jgi:hypothetical protein
VTGLGDLSQQSSIQLPARAFRTGQAVVLSLLVRSRAAVDPSAGARVLRGKRRERHIKAEARRVPELPFRLPSASLRQVCYASAIDKTGCGSAVIAFVVTSSPLVAVLSGANVVAGQRPVTLDCSRSFDPDAEPEAMSYTWTCEGPSPQGCYTSTQRLLELGTSAQQVRFQRSLPRRPLLAQRVTWVPFVRLRNSFCPKPQRKPPPPTFSAGRAPTARRGEAQLHLPRGQDGPQ